MNTWVVAGRNLQPLAEELHKRDGIDMVAPFGAELHVTRPRQARARCSDCAAKKADGAHSWKRGEPRLEDVFILLMDQSKDNFA